MAIVKYHIGTTRWGLKEWKGVFFTDQATPDQFLAQYASVFNAVEGNTTFYRIPDDETIRRWGEQVPDDFRFCFKLPSVFTHERRLSGVRDDVIRFLDRFNPVREHLGPFHIQLSPGFSFQEFAALEDLLSELPAEYSYAVEPRHPDYFDRGDQERAFDHLLRNLHIDRVLFDTRRLYSLNSREESIRKAREKKPRVPLRFTTTGSRPFLRYVGSNDIPNNEPWLKEWAIVVADWIREGLHPYVFIHAPDSRHAPELTRHFHRELSRLIELNPMPTWPADRQDEQLGLF